MSRFAPTRRLNIVLAHNLDHPVATLDLAPHRITLHGGTTFEDVVLYLATLAARNNKASFGPRPDLSLHAEYREENNGKWNLFLIKDSFIVTERIDTPFADFAPGAVTIAFDDTCDDDLNVIFSKDSVTLPNGTQVPTSDFLYEDIFTNHTSNAIFRNRGDMFSNLAKSGETTPRLALMGALIQASLPYETPQRGAMIRHIGAVMARASALLELGYRSGRDGKSAAMEDVTWAINELHGAYHIRPDRIWAPATMVASEDLAADLAAIVPENYRLLASEAIALLQDAEDFNLSTAALTVKGDMDHLSQHKRLTLFDRVSKIDKIILRHAPEAVMKPGALRKRKKLAA